MRSGPETATTPVTVTALDAATHVTGCALVRPTSVPGKSTDGGVQTSRVAQAPRLPRRSTLPVGKDGSFEYTSMRPAAGDDDGWYATLIVADVPFGSTSGTAGGETSEKSALVPAAAWIPRTVSVPSPQLSTTNDFTERVVTEAKSSSAGEMHIFGSSVPPCSGTESVLSPPNETWSLLYLTVSVPTWTADETGAYLTGMVTLPPAPTVGGGKLPGMVALNDVSPLAPPPVM